MKYHSLGGLTDRNVFLTALELEIQDRGAGRFVFFWGLSPWLTGGMLVSVSSCGLPSVHIHFFVLIASCKAPGHFEVEPIHMNSFFLNYLFKGPDSKYSHILKHRCVCAVLSHSVVSVFAAPWAVALPGSSAGNSPGKNTGVGCHSLLQGIFLTQGLNPGLLHCRRILYCLSH